MAVRKSPQQKLDELREKEAQLKARIQKEKAKLATDERKRDTRRKIIAGALALEHAEQNPDSEFATVLHRLLSRHVDRDQDRALFDLPSRKKANDSDSQSEANPPADFQNAAAE